MRELVALIRSNGYTVSQFATVAGIPEARLIEILFTGRFVMDKWLMIEKAFGVNLSLALGKAPCDFVSQKKKQPGQIINFKEQKVRKQNHEQISVSVQNS